MNKLIKIAFNGKIIYVQNKTDTENNIEIYCDDKLVGLTRL